MNTTPQERLALGVTALLITAGAGVRMITPDPATPKWVGEIEIAADSTSGALLAEATAEAAREGVRSQPLSSGETIDPNRASVDQLQRLPGVGPALAERIARWREDSGPYRTLADLDQVTGIGPAMLAEIGPYLSLPRGGDNRGNSAELLDLNRATLTELEALPGVGPVLAGRIIEWRAKNGRFRTVAELDSVSGVGPALLAELTPLVKVP